MINSLPNKFLTAIGIFVLLAVPYALVLVLPGDLVFTLVAEDGLIEWVGALAFFVASLIFARLYLLRQQFGNNFSLRAVWLSALALLCFLAAGEEISWGQRIFGFATPSVIAESNVQEEMNIHNLKIFDSRLSADGAERKEGIAKLLTFGILAKLIWMGFLIALPIAYGASHVIRKLVNGLQIPVPPVWVAVAGIACYAFSRLLFNQGAALGVDEFLTRISADEIKECIVAFLFLTSAIAVYRQSAAQALSPRTN